MTLNYKHRSRLLVEVLVAGYIEKLKKRSLDKSKRAKFEAYWWCSNYA
jgi:hypothetical protein